MPKPPVWSLSYRMSKKAYFVASTGQNVGKTTACLGLFSGLKKRVDRVGFIKPVGQEQIETDCGHHVDKDVILFKEHFELSTPYEMMSPVLFPPGFTRDFLDGKISEKHLREKISECYASVAASHDLVLLEGTGHTAVGSIANINNAQVAALLNVPMLLVAPGGLGSALDELALNKALCEKHGAQVAGVILNRVLPDKREMVIHYMTKALARWDIPLIGCIPYDSFLSNPTMKDFEILFHTTLLSGEQHRIRHFKQTRLIDTSLETYKDLISKNQLIITPANREDIILETLSYHWDLKIAHPEEDSEAGMILTGNVPPKASIVEQIKKAEIPMLYAPVNSYPAMKLITSFTAKIRREDVAKVKEAIEVVESHIDFNFFNG
jgi:phosphate acetyltransferase